MAESGDGGDLDSGLVDEAKASLSSVASRLADPLLGSFALSWALWNWKFVFVLVHGGADAGAVKIIDEALSSLVWWRAYVAPPLFALFYTFVYAYIAREVSVWRAGIKAEGQTRAARKEDTEARILAKERHEKELFTREEWLKGPEIAEVIRLRDEADRERELALQAMVDAHVRATQAVFADSSVPNVTLVSAPEGVTDHTFAHRTSPGEVYRLPPAPPGVAADNVAYVLRSFPGTKRALVAPLGSYFPNMQGVKTGLTECLTPRGQESLREMPPETIVRVQLRNDLGDRWAQLLRGRS
jgi:hypothetical protein